MSHIHEKIDFVVIAYVVHDGKVLLRMHDKYHIWLGPGGHIELDEDPNQAVVREVKEEAGLDIVIYGVPAGTKPTEQYRDLIPPIFMNRHRVSETHEHISLAYFGTTKDNVLQPRDAAEDNGAEMRWFTKEELSDPKYDIRADVQYYASKALELLS